MPGSRIYRCKVIQDDGSLTVERNWTNITCKSKLRSFLIEHAPLDTYFSVSTWLNPTKTRHKTYKKPWDGRRHIDKNGFLWSDGFIDCDHEEKEHVEEIRRFLLNDSTVIEEVAPHLSKKDTYLVFSGGGYHINLDKAFRFQDTWHPIEREKKCHRHMQQLAWELRDHGFNFDHNMQTKNTPLNKSDIKEIAPNISEKELSSTTSQEVVINSPTSDTRRVRKLPQTITRYGYKAETVNNLHSYQPTQAIPTPELEIPDKSVQTLDEIIEEAQTWA